MASEKALAVGLMAADGIITLFNTWKKAQETQARGADLSQQETDEAVLRMNEASSRLEDAIRAAGGTPVLPNQPRGTVNIRPGGATGGPPPLPQSPGPAGSSPAQGTGAPSGNVEAGGPAVSNQPAHTASPEPEPQSFPPQGQPPNG